MPTPNYGYEKRQKELAKKRKKEEKLKAKADRKAGVAIEGDDTAMTGDEAPGNPEEGTVPNPPLQAP